MILMTRKTLYHFYHQAAEQGKNRSGRVVFERLAEETRSNLKSFFHLYQGVDFGSFDQFMQSVPFHDSTLLNALKGDLSPDIHNRRARELALREEESLEQMLRMTAARVIDPVARQTLERAANETRAHLALIESEYAHTMRMVHETDIDTYVRE
jgi:rubrerythrin